MNIQISEVNHGKYAYSNYWYSRRSVGGRAVIRGPARSVAYDQHSY